MALYFNGTAMALTGGFTVALVATTPLFAAWMVAYIFEFYGPTLSVSTDDAPMALCSWHVLET